MRRNSNSLNLALHSLSCRVTHIYPHNWTRPHSNHKLWKNLDLTRPNSEYASVLCSIEPPANLHTYKYRLKLKPKFYQWIFSARQHICYSALYAIGRPSVRPSVRLSVTRVDQSKTVEVKITQPSPQSSPMTLVSWRSTSPWNSKGKIGSGGAE